MTAPHRLTDAGALDGKELEGALRGALTDHARYRRQAPEENRLSGLRVLVCEDEVDCRDLLREVLVSEGATVVVVAAAADALDDVQEFRPHVLVSDIGLPLMDGYALMREIRQLPEHRGGNTPAIALTAYASAADERRAALAGFQVHVAKPIDPDVLVSRIADLAVTAAQPPRRSTP